MKTRRTRGSRQAPTLMALVDWHLTWCDTVAVWFISGRTSTHAQPSGAAQKQQVKSKRGRGGRGRCPIEQVQLLFSPAASSADWLREAATHCYCTWHARWMGRCARTDEDEE